MVLWMLRKEALVRLCPGVRVFRPSSCPSSASWMEGVVSWYVPVGSMSVLMAASSGRVTGCGAMYTWHLMHWTRPCWLGVASEKSAGV